MSDATFRVDRCQAEQFMQRHLTLFGGRERSDFRFHRAVIRQFLTEHCRRDDGNHSSQLILNEKRLLGWLIREARRRTTASAGSCFAAVSRYVRGLMGIGLLKADLMAAFQNRHGGRGWPILAAALQSPDPLVALVLLQPKPAAPGPITTHADRYVELHRATGKDFQPNKSLLTHLDRFLLSQGILSPQAITPQTIELWVGAIIGNARTRFKKVRMAWHFFNHLLGLKVLNSNPITPVLYSLGRSPKSTFKPFIYSQEQVASILSATRQLPSNSLFPLRAETCSIIFTLLYSLGLRMGEACRLRIRDISLVDATLFIDQTKFYKSRYVAFGPQLGRRLQQFLDLRHSRQSSLEKDDPLFVARGPGHVDQSGMNNTFRAVVDRLGIHGEPGHKAPRPHDLRHSADCRIMPTVIAA